jgi:AraC-like DNA-binding protein
MQSAIESLASYQLAASLLANLEPRLKSLPPALYESIIDLFTQPSRYETGEDLARQAGIGTKRVYRELAQAGLKPPKQLVVFAKTVHAYGYLQFSNLSLRLVQKKLGYISREPFARHVRFVLDCHPTDLRSARDREELLLRLIEWTFKPNRPRMLVKDFALGDIDRSDYGSSKHQAPPPTGAKTNPFA